MSEPLTPPDCDLRDWPSMLLDVARLRRSKAWLKCKRTPMLAFYMLNLWTASWHDKPAASLEDDDDVLADLAMCDASKWPKVRDDALHGWVRCTDGRLYHPVVAEKALECWLDHLARALSSGAGNAKRWKTPFDPKPIEDQMATTRDLLRALNPQSKALTKRKTSGVPFQTEQDAGGSPEVIPPGSQEKVKVREDEGKVLSDPIGSGAAGAPPPVDKSTTPNPDPAAKRAAWRTCGQWMVANGMAEATAREVMGLVLKDYPAVAIDAFVAAPKQAETPDPKAYLIATAKRLAGERKASPTVPSDDADKTAAYLAQQAAEKQAAQAALAANGGKVPDSVREAAAKLRAQAAAGAPAQEGAAA